MMAHATLCKNYCNRIIHNQSLQGTLMFLLLVLSKGSACYVYCLLLLLCLWRDWLQQRISRYWLQKFLQLWLRGEGGRGGGGGGGEKIRVGVQMMVLASNPVISCTCAPSTPSTIQKFSPFSHFLFPWLEKFDINQRHSGSDLQIGSNHIVCISVVCCMWCAQLSTVVRCARVRTLRSVGNKSCNQLDMECACVVKLSGRFHQFQIHIVNVSTVLLRWEVHLNYFKRSQM